MTSAVRVAVLGAGFMGSTHARAYHGLEGSEVATIYAKSGDRAEALAGEFGISWTNDLDAILADPSIDAVDICLPTSEHRVAVEAAIGAGKHVLVEKPLALTLSDGEALVALSDQTDRVVMVAHVLRFWPEYAEIRRILDTGELGKPISGNAVRRQASPNWTKLEGRSAQTGGSILDMLVHDYDALNWMLGQPVEVQATARHHNTYSGGYDHSQVLIRYGDASAVVDGGSMMPESYPFTSRLEILCERGSVEYHFQAGGRSFEVGTPTNTLTIYRNEGDPEVISVAQSDPYISEVAYFVDCVRRGIPAEQGTPAQSLTALQVGLAATESVRTGSPVKIQ